MQQELIIKFWRQPLPEATTMSLITRDLQNALGETAELDGHDTKGEEINLFIKTDDPKHTFRRVKKVLESHAIKDGFSAASRLIGGAQFSSIWPLRPMKKFKLP